MLRGMHAPTAPIRSLVHLSRQALADWRADFAPSMGAALSFYTWFSLAPVIVIAIAVAGLLFAREAVEGQVFAQLQNLVGTTGAAAAEKLVEAASTPSASWVATIIGLVTMLIGATTVFAELQSDLDRIWKAPAPASSGVWQLLRTRFLSFGLILGIGFLMLVSLVTTALLTAFGQWWASSFGGWALLLQFANFLLSFALTAGLFAMIYKILPSCPVAWRDVWIGAIVTSLLFSLGKLAIGVYLGHSNVTAAYGAAGSIAVLLLWVYYAAQIFLLGAEFTHVYATSHGSLVAKADATAPASAPDGGATAQRGPALVRSVIE
jgi:membrane protein